MSFQFSLPKNRILLCCRRCLKLPYHRTHARSHSREKLPRKSTRYHTWTRHSLHTRSVRDNLSKQNNNKTKSVTYFLSFLYMHCIKMRCYHNRVMMWKLMRTFAHSFRSKESWNTFDDNEPWLVEREHATKFCSRGENQRPKGKRRVHCTSFARIICGRIGLWASHTERDVRSGLQHFNESGRVD